MNIDFLRARASSHFEQYLNDFLISGETTGLPAERLSESEWEQLNDTLKPKGVVLVPKERGGILYYWFRKYYLDNNNKINSYDAGREKIVDIITKQIRAKYPNLSETTIKEMIKTGGNVGDIYEKLRYKQDGKYTDVSQQQFQNAVIYALYSCGNKDTLVQIPFYHHWNPDEYRDTYVFNMRVDWKANRTIEMSGTQDWTWFRKCGGAVLPPVYDPRNPKGFHISLNVRVTEELLRVLDNILIEDGGRYISSYKFPKGNFYDEITTRHDPVTIYISARNPELEARITRAVQPFVRSNEGMIGEMLGNGVCINPETSTGQNGISVGQQISQDIASYIKGRL